MAKAFFEHIPRLPWMQHYLLTIGSFLLTVELLCSYHARGNIMENKFMFLGSQASGHQALSAFLREPNQALPGTFRQYQAESGGMICMFCHDFA